MSAFAVAQKESRQLRRTREVRTCSSEQNFSNSSYLSRFRCTSANLQPLRAEPAQYRQSAELSQSERLHFVKPTSDTHRVTAQRS